LKFKDGFGPLFCHISVMRKRGRIILAAVILTALGGFAWWALEPRPPDPVYGGHPLSYWVDLPSPLPQKPSALDSNAVPYLVQALKSKDGTLRKTYQKLWDHLPGWLQDRAAFPKSAANMRYNACWLLGFLRAKARPAIPELVRLLREDDDENVRMVAADSLGKIANRDDKAAVEALVATVANADSDYFRGIATDSLKRLDPGTAANAGITNFPNVVNDSPTN
jgi:HEAT repeat protein